MSKNATGAAPVFSEKPAADTEVEKPNASQGEQKPDGCTVGFYCYIGPNLAGLIQNGAIFRGTRTDAMNAAAEAIKKQPLVKTLIVSGDELAEARLKVKRKGNALNANYEKIAASKRQ